MTRRQWQLRSLCADAYRKSHSFCTTRTEWVTPLVQFPCLQIDTGWTREKSSHSKSSSDRTSKFMRMTGSKQYRTEKNRPVGTKAQPRGARFMIREKSHCTIFTIYSRNQESARIFLWSLCLCLCPCRSHCRWRCRSLARSLSRMYVRMSDILPRLPRRGVT